MSCASDSRNYRLSLPTSQIEISKEMVVDVAVFLYSGSGFSIGRPKKQKAEIVSGYALSLSTIGQLKESSFSLVTSRTPVSEVETAACLQRHVPCGSLENTPPFAHSHHHIHITSQSIRAMHLDFGAVATARRFSLCVLHGHFILILTFYVSLHL